MNRAVAYFALGIMLIAARAGAADKSDWWSLKPIKKVDPPTSLDATWVRTPVDAFIRAKLQAAGMAPSPEADRRTLIRRIYFDLVGLPPAPEDVDRFVADADPRAYE